MSYRGSEWRRWDLHIHTKDTNKNDQFTSVAFDDFCNAMYRKAIDNNIAVVGITDYFSIENYKKILLYIQNLDSNSLFNVEEKEQIRQITLIPNVELRMLPSTREGRLINIHCLFNPEYVDKLDDDFFGTIQFASGIRSHKMNRNGFKNLGYELGETNDENAYRKGLENYVVSHKELQNLFDNNSELRDNTVIVVCNKSKDGVSGIQSQHFDQFEGKQNSSLDATRQAIYKISNIIFSSNQGDIDYFLGLKGDKKEDVIKKCGSLKPCIHGSDAHTESKLFSPDDNRYCWIKANPTFEGLKQVIYEPSRVYIGENKPQSALHKLEEIKLGFDNNTKWGSDKFCFSEFESKLLFSPNLTCIIGGRGSGKSTLLNLIAEKIGKSDKDFFSKVIPQEIKSKIIFTPEVIDNIEFLAQNTIENFAKDSKEFTKAIFERLDKKSNGKLLEIEQENIEQLKAFDAHIKLLETRLLKHKELEEKKKELKKFESIVKTLTDKQYIKNKDELQKTQKQLIDLENSRKKYEELYTKLKEFTQDYKPIGEPKDNYQNYYNELVSDLSSLFDKYKNKNYEDVKKLMDDLKMKKSLHIQQIEEYLKSKGMNEDNIKDAQNASTSIEQIKSEILELKQAVMKIWRSKKQFNTDTIDKSIDEFKVKIESELEIINSKFIEIARKNSQDVKIIKVEYQQDSDVFDLIFDTFLSKLPEDIVKKIDKSTFRNYLKNIEPAAVLEFKKSKDFLKQIETSISKSSLSTQTYKGLEEVFGQEFNFQLYKLLIQKAIKNIRNSKLLNVSYDGKPLKNSSFGQRCTAAIVILLSLGNNPIIIDEPEAHLDSSLIANYLVELIKEQKQQRQIIFATHNANFVLNGDAELIIKLENTDGLTKSTSFAIEDIKYREDLLKLEGGREAFKKREQKYNI